MSNSFYSKTQSISLLPHWSILLEHLKYKIAVLTEFFEQRFKFQKENMTSIMSNLMWKSIPPVFLKFQCMQIVYSIHMAERWTGRKNWFIIPRESSSVGLSSDFFRDGELLYLWHISSCSLVYFLFCLFFFILTPGLEREKKRERKKGRH